MARQTAVVGVAASGMTLIIVLGGIDLSVGSAVALTTVVIASLLRGGASPWTAALAGVAVAALTGAVNGALVAGLGVTPFIVTLGSMSILRGAAKGLAHEQQIDADPRGLDALMLQPTHGFLLFSPAVWMHARASAPPRRCSCAARASAGTWSPSAATSTPRGSAGSRSSG